MTAVTEYDVKVDTKKRLTIRGATYDYYHVQELPDGQIILQPRELTAPFELSKRTLGAMDKSIANLKKGKASKAVDLSEFTPKPKKP